MSDDQKPGAIYAVNAYAQGKMLDHSGWHGILPRGITPSDIDVVFDNYGDILFCELSSKHATWPAVSRGQLFTYFNAIGPVSRHFAVLLKHSVAGRQIDSFKDIDSFQVMLRKDSEALFWPAEDRVRDGPDEWQKFVQWWFKDVNAARKWTVERAVASESDIDCIAWLAEYERAYVEHHGAVPW